MNEASMKHSLFICPATLLYILASLMISKSNFEEEK